MKIVILHTDFRIYWPARIKALDAALKMRGDSLTVIEIAGKGSPYAFSGHNESADIDWRILFPESKPEDLSGKQIQQKLYPVLDNINPDVILSGAIAFPSGALAADWRRRHGKRLVVFDNSKSETVQRNGLVDFIKQAVYNGVDAMLYPSSDWLETGLAWGFDAERQFHGLNVVDNAFWSKPSGMTNDRGRYIVSVGRQIPKKNHLLITQAFIDYAKAAGEDAMNLLLIGDGPLHAEIKAMAENSGVGDKIILEPFMSQQDLVPVYQNARCLILGSTNQETWGLVLNEAMAAGCPVIASEECGATNTIVRDGVNGFRYEYSDTARLTELMRRFGEMSEPEWHAMSAAAREMISHWDVDRFADGCCRAIDYVTTHPGRPLSLKDRIIISLWKGRYRPV